MPSTECTQTARNTKHRSKIRDKLLRKCQKFSTRNNNEAVAVTVTMTGRPQKDTD